MTTRTFLVRGLTARLDRLAATFDALHAAVRDKVAEVLGRAVADAVRNLVRVALEPTAVVPFDACNDSEWDDRDRQPEPTAPAGDDEDLPPASPRPPVASAVAAGCRVADWCRARWLSPAWSVAAGLLAGAASYLSGPWAAAVAPAVSALALVAEAAALTHTLSP